MKHTFSAIIIALTLALALVIGVVALAENAEQEAPAIEQPQPEQTPAEPDAPATDAASDSAALQEAFKAYNEAKASSHQEALEAELKEFVASGKLTQAQADLILNYTKEQQSLRDGVCPGCGYRFQNGQGKGGRANGGFGSRGGRANGGFGGKGGRGRMGQQPAEGQDNGGANGMSFVPGVQAAPGMTGDEGV